jgi:hypothetical protein
LTYRSFRRVAVSVAAIAVVASFVVGVTPARAAESDAFVFGSGSASASVAHAKLFYGGLTLPVGVGTTSASYQNHQSRALGIALDVGSIVGLAGDVPKQLQPTIVDSNSGDKEAHGNLDAGQSVARANLKATSVPASSSEVRMADLDLPALVRVEGAHTRSKAEVKGGRQRVAAATSEVARMTIGGVVTLENLQWQVTETSGFEPASNATFSVGRVLIGGVPTVLPGADLNGALAPINAALKPVGLRIEAPKLNKTKDGVSIGPVRVALANSPLGKQVLGPIIASARPLLAPAFDALTNANKSLGLIGLVADIALGVADGSGGVEVGVGGAAASTSAVGFVPPKTTPSQVESVSLPNTSLSGAAPLAGLGTAFDPIPDTVLDAPKVATTSSSACVLEAAPRRKGDCRSGNVAAALLISGVAVAGLAAAEFGVRRRRRGSAEVIA